jgi:hypothetical protein
MEVLAFLLNEGRDIILKDLPLNSCVSSTRICIEVLKLAGVLSKPQAVYAVAANSGLTVVGRNPGGVPGGWNGHLVCVTDDSLIDLTLDQIGLAPIAVRFDGEFPIAVSSGGVPLLYFRDECPSILEGHPAWEESWVESFEKIKSAIL